MVKRHKHVIITRIFTALLIVTKIAVTFDDWNERHHFESLENGLIMIMNSWEN